MPHSATVYCGKALSRASSARQSKALRPVFDEMLEIAEIGAIRPGLAGRLVGETRSPEPFAEIDDGLIGNFERERLRLSRHGDLVWLSEAVSIPRRDRRPDRLWLADRRIPALSRMPNI
jgi:hypothetical protein